MIVAVGLVGCGGGDEAAEPLALPDNPGQADTTESPVPAEAAEARASEQDPDDVVPQGESVAVPDGFPFDCRREVANSATVVLVGDRSLRLGERGRFCGRPPCVSLPSRSPHRPTA